MSSWLGSLDVSLLERILDLSVCLQIMGFEEAAEWATLCRTAEKDLNVPRFSLESFWKVPADPSKLMLSVLQKWPASFSKAYSQRCLSRSPFYCTEHLHFHLKNPLSSKGAVGSCSLPPATQILNPSCMKCFQVSYY